MSETSTTTPGNRDNGNHAPANKKYPLSLRALHWLMAVIIIGLIPLGYYMSLINESSPEFADKLLYWHKSFGLLIFFLIIIRFVVRKRSTLQPLPENISAKEKIMARISHFALYVLMFSVPFLGALMSSTYENNTGLHFFFMDLPEFTPKNETVSFAAFYWHRVLAYTLLATASIHILGALKHRFIDKENDIIPRIT